jgi:hypothetical protein
MVKTNESINKRSLLYLNLSFSDLPCRPIFSRPRVVDKLKFTIKPKKKSGNPQDSVVRIKVLLNMFLTKLFVIVCLQCI